MANLKNGRKFSAEFNKATEVNRQTRLLAQTPNEPVEYVDLEQVAEVVNEGMATQADLNTTNENVATNAGNIQTLQNEVGNRYTKAETDAEINEAINEVEQTIEKIEQTNKDTYATKTGKYKKLTAGFAYEILGDGQATSEQFSFRPTGGPNRNVRDGSARIEVLKGNSVVWNQLVDADTTSVTLTANHKYITNIGGTISLQSPTSATTINVEGGVDKVTNLTQMFGAKIANTISKPEQFYEMMPIVANPAAYNTGKIVDANYKAIKTTGFNQWDEQWELGMFDTSTGGKNVSYENIRNANPIRVLPNTTYYEEQPIVDNLLMFVLEYTQDGTYIGFQYVYNMTFTTSPNTAYVNFYMSSVYGTTYNNDICINIAWDEYSALNGKYKPYKPFERDLSWASKYFPNGMRSAGNVTDEIRFNSTTQKWEAVQRIGVVDLGSLNWTYSTNVYGNGGAGFIAYVSKAKFSNTDIVKGNILSSTYSTVSAYAQVTGQDKSIACYNAFNNRIVVTDSAYTDAATFKSAMAGVMLNYELATPIVTPITEDVNLAYDVADYGTEQLIVADGAQSAPLSAEIAYENNASKLLEQIAPALDRLDAIEAILATMQASVVANTNEE